MMCTKSWTDYVCIVTINLLLSIYIVADKLVVNHISSLISIERSRYFHLCRPNIFKKKKRGNVNKHRAVFVGISFFKSHFKKKKNLEKIVKKGKKIVKIYQKAVQKFEKLPKLYS